MNMMMNKALHLPFVLALATLCVPALADDGHNHGPAPAAATAAETALPRFTATSELFELVGVAKGRQLTVYLDGFADNAPVKGATLDLEVGGAKVALKGVADGEFEGALAQALKPGLTPVAATVMTASDTDILAGEFDVHADETHAAHGPTWAQYLGWLLAAGAVLLALAWSGRRAIAARRLGGAA